MSSSKREEYARLLRPLHYAVLMRDCDAIRNQLKHRADVIAQNQDGDTALHMLCYPQRRKSSRDARLMSHPALRKYDGLVLLYPTVGKWDEECARLEKDIIRQLAAADRRCFRARDAAGNTPLMSCLKAPNTKIAVVMALMEQELHVRRDGIDFDILNNENESALDLAFASGRSDYVNAICIYRFEKSRAVSVTSTIMRVYKMTSLSRLFLFHF